MQLNESYIHSIVSSKKKEMIFDVMNSFNYYRNLLVNLGTPEFEISLEQSRIEVMRSFDIYKITEHFNKDLKIISHGNRKFFESISD